MKSSLIKAILFLSLINLCLIDIFSQRIGYVDTDYIFSQMDEYQDAEKKIETLSKEWQKKLDKFYKDIDRMYKEYKTEEVLLTEEMKVLKESEIEEKRKEAASFQKAKFGISGELFSKRKTLTKPIQDRVYDAIHAVAKTSNLDFIFDKSGAVSILYGNPKYNKSSQVLRKLGYKNK